MAIGWSPHACKGQAHGDHQRRRGEICLISHQDGKQNQQQASWPPWVTPSCPTSTKHWKGALLNLPWPAGVQPDFRTVFSHEWTGTPLMLRI